MNDSPTRAARRALKPNAIILGAATCLFGWAVAEFLRPGGDHAHPTSHLQLALLSSATLLVASAGLATNRAGGNLLAACLSCPLPLLHAFIFFSIPLSPRVTFLSADHLTRWLDKLAAAPVSFWLLTALSVAILCSATAATLRRTPPLP